MANLRIDIASEFTGRKAFQQAQTATTGLEKSVDALGKKLTTAFSAYKIAQFAKESVKAFAEDQKSAALLAQTLKNVNQGYATDMVNNYIAKSEALYGILDEKLRPAFSTLVIATKDAAYSQKLLQTALDVSAGTGKDLQSVATALSKAYLGNNTALMRLGAGLSKTTLQGKSFNDIISVLNQNFAGQAATAADTYQGKLDRLNVAFDNMKETIGKGIVDAFSNLAGNGGFNKFINDMDGLATHISNIIVGFGELINFIKQIPGAGILGKVFGFAYKTSVLGMLDQMGAKKEISKSQPSGITNFLSDMQKIADATAKVNTIQNKVLTTTKALTKEQKDQLALKKASVALDQANQIFNMDKIELAAAAMAKQSQEDYARIKLKQDLISLQDAINAGNAEEATRLAGIVQADYQRVWAFQAQNIALGIQNGTIANIANAASLIPKDLNLINLDNLKSALDLLAKLIAQLANVKTTVTTGTTSPTQSGVVPIPVPFDPNSPHPYGPQSEGQHFLANPNLNPNDLVGVPFNPNVTSNYGAGNPNLQVTVNVQGSVTTQQDLVSAIIDGIQTNTASGIKTTVNRLNPEYL